MLKPTWPTALVSAFPGNSPLYPANSGRLRETRRLEEEGNVHFWLLSVCSCCTYHSSHSFTSVAAELAHSSSWIQYLVTSAIAEPTLSTLHRDTSTLSSGFQWVLHHWVLGSSATKPSFVLRDTGNGWAEPPLQRTGVLEPQRPFFTFLSCKDFSMLGSYFLQLLFPWHIFFFFLPL